MKGKVESIHSKKKTCLEQPNVSRLCHAFITFYLLCIHTGDRLKDSGKNVCSICVRQGIGYFDNLHWVL